MTSRDHQHGPCFRDGVKHTRRKEHWRPCKADSKAIMCMPGRGMDDMQGDCVTRYGLWRPDELQDVSQGATGDRVLGLDKAARKSAANSRL